MAMFTFRHYYNYPQQIRPSLRQQPACNWIKMGQSLCWICYFYLAQNLNSCYLAFLFFTCCSFILSLFLFFFFLQFSLHIRWPYQNKLSLLSKAITREINSCMLTVLAKMRVWEIWSLLKTIKCYTTASWLQSLN